MEKELNIATILKDKPLDIKLWTDIFGEVTLDYVSKNGNGFNVKHHHSVLDKFLPNGKIYEEGALCIYPSKSMRDWSKFAWKKGNVLVSNEEIHVIFEKWLNDDYTAFMGAFQSIDGTSSICYTTSWDKEYDAKRIDKYISRIEKIKRGKLNLKTLEIDHFIPQKGDIVYIKCKDGHAILAIYERETNNNIFSYYALLTRAYFTAFDFIPIANSDEIEELRPATDSEKQQLFAALEKEGKHWNSETKTLENLPKNCEFKPLDYILVRDTAMALPLWQLYQYTYENANFVYVVGTFYGLDKNRIDFIPYNDQTAHLLGTTDDWEGGEE